MPSEKSKRGPDDPPDESDAKQAPLSHEAYTVGWVCALPKEQTAAIAMLDRRHTNIPSMQPPTDTNAYTLGSIGGHNIVIACLPKGQIGVSSAATVATNMVSTFPSIKIGLMVGIGGGIPSNKVRLGDVVVSTPTGPHPGVVQWDFGKAKEGGSFERTGSLNNPPTILLAALTKLESSHEIEGFRIDEYLEELGRKYPRLAAKYLRSERLRDILFKADCAHADADDTSSDEDDERPDVCRHCDKTKAKERKLRDTRIHYGLIASGNQVIKDGVFRDKLNKDLGGHVLCVEMEAAGLMTNFPCIIIRGICDYADSHKNKEWQEHAAAVAAACTKELLGKIEPHLIHAERPARDSLKNIQTTLSSTLYHVDCMRSQLHREEIANILNWLASVDYGGRQSDLFSRHQPGTGQWFITSDPFKTWKKFTGKTLFCPGIPGSGKTILTSLVVDHLSREFGEDNTIGLAYIFCDYRRQYEQSLEEILASLLKQLSLKGDGIPESVQQLHERHYKRSTRPSTAELAEALTSTVRSFARVAFVVDALDECQNDCRSRLISHLAAIQDEARISVLYTSRRILAIENQFKGCLTQPITANGGDVEAFIDSRLSQALKFTLIDPELKNMIQSTITRLVNGMFLLAQLYLDALNDATSVSEVRRALAELKGRNHSLATDNENRNVLYDAYDLTVERIKQQPPNSQALGMKTIMWVVFAERPLRPEELQYAMALKEGDSRLDRENLRDLDMILSTCAGLLVIDKRSDIVRPAHFTTQEYFMSRGNLDFSKAQSEITSACLTCLRLKDFWEVETTPSKHRRNDGFDALLSYVRHNWGRHARKATESHEPPMTPPNVTDLLTDKFLTGYLWADIENYGLGSALRYVPEHFFRSFGLHIAVHFDLFTAAFELVKQGADINYRPKGAVSPLMVASRSGNERFVEFLLRNGADYHAKDECGRTAVMYALANRHDKTAYRLGICGAGLGGSIWGVRSWLENPPHKRSSFYAEEKWSENSNVACLMYAIEEEKRVLELQETEGKWMGRRRRQICQPRNWDEMTSTLG